MIRNLCPKCDNKLVKNGTSNNKQRWRCKNCGFSMIEQEDRLTKLEKKALQLLYALLNSPNVRSIDIKDIFLALDNNKNENIEAYIVPKTEEQSLPKQNSFLVSASDGKITFLKLKQYKKGFNAKVEADKFVIKDLG